MMQNKHLENTEAELEYLSVKQVCEMTGLGPTFVRAEIKEGALLAFRIGANLRIRRADVTDWVEANAAA